MLTNASKFHMQYAKQDISESWTEWSAGVVSGFSLHSNVLFEHCEMVELLIWFKRMSFSDAVSNRLLGPNECLFRYLTLAVCSYSEADLHRVESSNNLSTRGWARLSKWVPRATYLIEKTTKAILYIITKRLQVRNVWLFKMFLGLLVSREFSRWGEFNGDFF